MDKLLVVAYREFKQRVTNRGFLIATFLMPVLILGIWAVSGVFSFGAAETQATAETFVPPSGAFGLVDRSGLADALPEEVPTERVVRFADEAAAQQALQSGQVPAYYLIPQDYRQSGIIERVSLELPAFPPNNDPIERILLSNLSEAAGIEDTGLLQQPLGPGGLQTVTLSSEGEAGATTFPILPLLVTMAVMLPLFTSASYLLQSLAAEKDSRIVEILLVSLRPIQMFAGKLVGVSGLILVQYLVWGAAAGVVLLVVDVNLAQMLGGFDLAANELLLALPFALGGFLMYASLMAGIGALAKDMEDSRMWVFLITLPMLLPIYLWFSIASAPNGLLAIVLSLFPYSAPVTMVLRMTVSAVPAWQVAASLALLLLAGVGTLWLAARLFRVQTLLSGESISAGRIWSALRSA